MRLPSIKSLTQIPGIDREQAEQIRQWLSWGNQWAKEKSPYPLPPAVENWYRLCLHEPSRLELAHAAVAWIISDQCVITWDVVQDQSEWRSYTQGPDWEAIGLGDSYIPTLIYRQTRRSPYSVGCIGDMPELNK